MPSFNEEVQLWPESYREGIMAGLKGVSMLPDHYRITRQDIIDALKKQQLLLQRGDVVLIRTGRMQVYDNDKALIAGSLKLRGADAAPLRPIAPPIRSLAKP